MPNTQPLTQLEFSPADFDIAHDIAKRLGYTQTAYTSTSVLWGLFCLADNASHRSGCIIKTRELGLMFVQDCENLKFYDLHERQLRNPQRIADALTPPIRSASQFIAECDAKDKKVR